jgi:hypothetical protein
MRSLRTTSNLWRFDNYVFALRQGVPHTVIQQLRLLIEEGPWEHHLMTLDARDGVDELWRFNFQRANDVGRDWPHNRIVTVLQSRRKARIGVAPQ